MAVWICVPRFLIEYYDEDILHQQGEAAWRFVKVVDHTLKVRSGNILAGMTIVRAKFARLCVEINLRKTLVSKFSINDKDYNIEHEGLNLICFNCGRFSDIMETYP